MVLDDSMPSTQSPLSGGIEGKGEREWRDGVGEKNDMKLQGKKGKTWIG